MTIEKVVVELGGVCRSRDDLHVDPQDTRDDGEIVDTKVRQATEAVTSLLHDGGDGDDDAVVREAWNAVRRAQDAIAALRETVGRSRDLRGQAQSLQDESFRLRRYSEAGRADPRRGRQRTPDRDPA